MDTSITHSYLSWHFNSNFVHFYFPCIYWYLSDLIAAQLVCYNCTLPISLSLSRFMSKLLRGEGDAKFTRDELESLSLTQVRELKYSLAGLVSARTSELNQEENTCFHERKQLNNSKEEARNLEQMAWLTLKPFLNLHPSLDDLTRVLMS